MDPFNLFPPCRFRVIISQGYSDTKVRTPISLDCFASTIVQEVEDPADESFAVSLLVGAEIPLILSRRDGMVFFVVRMLDAEAAFHLTEAIGRTPRVYL